MVSTDAVDGELRAEGVGAVLGVGQLDAQLRRGRGRLPQSLLPSLTYLPSGGGRCWQSSLQSAIHAYVPSLAGPHSLGIATAGVDHSFCFLARVAVRGSV